MRAFILYLVAGVAGTLLVTAAIRLIWRALGAYQINRAGPRPLLPARQVLWQEPDGRGDLTAGPGGADGAPSAPFEFLEEHDTGSQPCVSVLDGRGRRWRVKWGNEVQSESFAVRLVWACGYFGEVTYFIGSGRIDGAAALQRARSCVRDDGSFVDARFELDDPAVSKMFEEHSWSWDDNPFVGTRELNGLKILVMLLSNWDTKDRRDVARGSNTAIFVQQTRRWRREARYLITDWGGSMGRWGGNIVTRGRWDPDGFAAQTGEFVKDVKDGIVYFGYVGQRTADVAHNISPEDVAWLAGYLERLEDSQVRDALRASGATAEEADSFTRSIRRRIDQLVAVNRPSAAALRRG
jgi:hypothetical protein